MELASASMSSKGSEPGDGVIAMADIFKDMDSVHQRYPGLVGRELQDAIFHQWVVQANITLKFFGGPKGDRKLLHRHPLNNREQAAVVESYVGGLLEHGVVQGVRGAAWAIQDEANPEQYFLLSWGTLSDAMYVAVQRDPHNKQLKSSLATGIPACTVFHPRTPKDVVKHLITSHNDFHHGSANTFVQRYKQVEEMEAAWSKHASSNNITISSCPSTGENRYEAQYSRFVQKNYPGTCSSWRVFVAMKSFVHALKRLDMEQEYYDMCGARVNFLDQRLSQSQNADQVFLINAAIVNIFEKHFEQTLPTDAFKMALLQTLSFAVPLTSKSQAKQDIKGEVAAGINPDQAWLLQGGNAKEQIKVLAAPMDGAALTCLEVAFGLRLCLRLVRLRFGCVCVVCGLVAFAFCVLVAF